jgi:hypothetical protein
VIQRQIDCDPESPGVKAAPAFEFAQILYYFDKRFLCEFRGIVRIGTNLQHDVVDAILVLDYETRHSLRIAFSALLYQRRVAQADVFGRGLRWPDICICRFSHSVSPHLDQPGPKKFLRKTGNNEAEPADIIAQCLFSVN